MLVEVYAPRVDDLLLGRFWQAFEMMLNFERKRTAADTLT